jgi:hypothetical protein
MYKLNGLYNFDYVTSTKTYVGVDDQLIIRVSDGALIPTVEGNTDYQAFLKYQAEGGKVYGADEEVPDGQAAE